MFATRGLEDSGIVSESELLDDKHNKHLLKKGNKKMVV
jgi:hypothetical protein